MVAMTMITEEEIITKGKAAHFCWVNPAVLFGLDAVEAGGKVSRFE